MTIKVTALAAYFALMSAAASFAATVTVGGQDYDIGFVSGNVNVNFMDDSFVNIAATLEAQPFWGDADLALEFAEASLAAGIFPPPFGGLSFAYEGFGDFLVEIAGYGPNSTAPVPIVIFAAPNETVFATATLATVPLPAGGILLLSGLAGVAGLKRRKKRIA